MQYLTNLLHFMAAVTAIFNRTVQELQATELNANNGMPPTIAQAGRAFTTPSTQV